jgi:hypothetical protein
MSTKAPRHASAPIAADPIAPHSDTISPVPDTAPIAADPIAPALALGAPGTVAVQREDGSWCAVPA